MAIDKSKPVVIYDGECNFCIAQIERIRKLDKNNQFEYLPRQDPNAEQRFPVLKSIDFNKGMRLIVPSTAGGAAAVGNLTGDGIAANYAGADALYQIARRLPGVNLIAWLYLVPGINQIIKLGYAWVAKNRARLSGLTCNSGSCDIHN